MLSGAYYTEVDCSRVGEYELDIIAASGDLQAVTSVVFWDGPEGVVGDYNEMSPEQEEIPYLMAHENCSCCQVEHNNIRGTNGAVRNATEATNSYSYIGLWCQFENGTEAEQGETVKLDFDPSDAWHKYTIQFIEERIFATKVDRSIRLFIDDQFKAVLTGIPPLSPTTKLILSVWNKHNLIPKLMDPFEPPTATASFRSVSLPPASNSLCLYGNPFRNGNHAVVRFEAAVGSAKLLDDVEPFREVAKPCIPCSVPCDVLICDQDCNEDQAYVHQVLLTGLHLSPSSFMENGDTNTSIPAVYYLTVRAVAGSGRIATASSNGIYIDITPPIVENLFHVDLSWSPDEPTSYQGDNSTIAVYWEGYDIESEVVECQWAVGTSPGDTDIKNFTSVGPDQHLLHSEDLGGELINKQTYYVTVRLVNGAGLVSEKTTSGVTILLDPPDTSSSNTTSTSCAQHVEGSVISRSSVDLCGDQNQIGITWTRVQDDSVNSYVFSVGTSSDNPGDVIPQTQVGYNESGWVQVLEGELSFGRTKVNISDLRSRTDPHDTRTRHKFYVEPGRTMFTSLTACNAGHKCAEIVTRKRTIFRPNDNLMTFENGSAGDIVLIQGQQSEYISINITVTRLNGRALQPNAIGAGILTDHDVSRMYTVSTPYITNPAFTIHQTDRFLRNRVLRMHGQSFFVSSIGGDKMDAPLTITVTFNDSALVRDEVLAVVFWGPENEIWKDVHGTCTDNPEDVNNTIHQRRLSVQLCSTTDAYSHSNRSEQRYFSGSSQFAVVIINGTFQNQPPVLVSPTRMYMGEDEGTFVSQLIAKDPEDDDLLFSFNQQQISGGDLVELDAHGLLRYTPPLDFSGSKEIHITISESRVDYPLLSTAQTIVIDVGAENDHPRPFVVHDGQEKLQESGILRLTVEENHSENVDYEALKFVVGSFDVDTFDSLRLYIKAPLNGTIEVGNNVQGIKFGEPNCSMSINAKRREWERVFDMSWIGPAIPYPCGMTLPHPPDLLNWAVAAVTYTPNEHFFGEDMVKFYAMDAFGARSKLVTVTIHVLENPCVNGGRCVGPEKDPDCQDKSRSDGFRDYTCNCSVGLEGRYCEINLNDCLPDTCPKNYTCIDQINGYVCHCEPGWPCNGLTLGEIVGMTVGCIGALMILLIIFKMWVKKKDRERKIGPSLEGSQIGLKDLPSQHEHQTMNEMNRNMDFYDVVRAWEDEVEEVEFCHVEPDAANAENMVQQQPQLLLPQTDTDDIAGSGSFVSIPGIVETDTTL
ncbi:uncharacterized protein LOC144861602 [Branchiostoma floridae x Branchiostoma japonicum]